MNVSTAARTVRRLPNATRRLAARALAGEHGRSMERAAFSMDPDFMLSMPTRNRIYAEAVRLIAQHAPLRVLSGERIVGSATLAEAREHRVPLIPFSSISHTTLGFQKALRVGWTGIRREIRARLARPVDDDGRDLLEAMLVCLDAAGEWHRRHLRLLDERIAGCAGPERAGYEKVRAALANVPENPPSNFREALQSLWFTYAFQRLCGNWSGIGRFDKMLGPYLRRDLRDGRLTPDDARDLVAHFWIKGCEWIRGDDLYMQDPPSPLQVFPRGSGDAQFYQNIVLAGVDERGEDVTNEVTYLVLDVVEELHISDFPIAVRLNRRTPEKLLRRVAEVQRLGGGIVAVYNEERVISNLIAFGYPPEDARNFANDGCWEILVPGRTKFIYSPVDILQVLQQTLGLGPDPSRPDFPEFDDLYRAFERRLAGAVNACINGYRSGGDPAPLAALLVDGCIEKARGYHHLGPVYTVHSPHASGLQDAANSLLVIRQLVYRERRFGPAEFADILRADWQGHETLRRRIACSFEFFGNDSPEADAMVSRVFDTFTELVGRVRIRDGVLRPAGISTFGREMSLFRDKRAAAASGHHKGDVLACNFSPTPGTDRYGPTAVIRSHCSVDFGRLPGGTALELKILPSSVAGEEGLNALEGLMRAFVQLGGIFMQIDVVDTALLRDAQEHPERYPNLSVRVSGWSARFATLDRDWQDLVIRRTQQEARR